MLAIVVTTRFDGGAGSLRDAVLEANNSPGHDEIVFDSSLQHYPWFYLNNGPITVTDSLTVRGHGANRTLIIGGSGGGFARVFDIDDQDSNSLIDVTFEDLQMRGGTDTGGGGAIRSRESLTVRRCHFAVSNAQFGGAISHFGGDLWVEDSRFSSSTATDHGGALQISTFAGQSATVVNTTFYRNNAEQEGGAISVFNAGGTVSLSFVTVYNNSTMGSGIGGGGISVSQGLVNIDNSIVARNSDSSGTAAEATPGLVASYSLVGDGTGSGLTPAPVNNPDINGNFVGTAAASIDPLVDFNNNSSSCPFCFGVLPSSPAVDSGGPSPLTPTFDQRGAPFTRVANGTPDMGAVELVMSPGPIVVTTAEDQSAILYDASDGISLREAIHAASGFEGDDVIMFDTAGVFATPQVIELMHGEIRSSAGDHDLRVVGPGAGNLTIDGRGESRLLYHRGGDGVFEVTGVTFTGGDATYFSNSGGAVLGFGTIEFSECVITGNTSGSGGGISVIGDLTVSNCQIVNNSASQAGGGIEIGRFQSTSSSHLTVRDSNISGNVAGHTQFGSGGGMRVIEADVLLDGVTISGNIVASGSGGGLASHDSDVTTQNSTISGNHALFGAAINFDGFFGDDLTINYSTIHDNIATIQGGGIFAVGDVTLSHTIVAGNVAPTNRDLSLRSFYEVNSSYSLVGDSSGSDLAEAPLGSPDDNGNFIGGPINGLIDPLLFPLGQNGGPTRTHALSSNSPALNAGDPSFAAPPDFDQRGTGFPRVQAGRIDIGAYESGPSQGVLVVTTANDEADAVFDAADLSLREAIQFANLYGGAYSTIRFDTDGEFATPQTIDLTLGQLTITTPMSIIGPGADQLTIDANDSSRAIRIDDFRYGEYDSVQISDMTITGGRLQHNGNGAGIYNHENLTVRNMVITGNTAIGTGGANGLGGGIRSDGPLVVINSQISGNTGTASGGGISAAQSISLVASVVEQNVSNNGGGLSVFGGGSVLLSVVRDNEIGGGIDLREGSLAVTSSTISGNTSATWGGGIRVNSATTADLIVNYSTISDNYAPIGGGLYVEEASLTLNSSTVSGNSAEQGGGVSTNDSDTVLNHVTLFSNSATTDGGGIDRTGSTGSLLINHTIVAGNSAPVGPDVDGATDAQYSLVGNNANSSLVGAPIGAPDLNGNLVGDAMFGLIDPLLGPLQNNGGFTLTHELLDGSPAIDAGDLLLANPPLVDQRASARIGNGVIDIGSVEFPLSGDFNQDGVYDCSDIDALTSEIAGTTHSAGFDLNGDGIVNLLDRDAWLAEAGAANFPSGSSYSLGDANLDGTVDGQDFQIWSANKFSSNSAWCSADFNADGSVDGHDFLIWNSNKSQSANSGESVPIDPARVIKLDQAPWHYEQIDRTKQPRPTIDIQDQTLVKPNDVPRGVHIAPSIAILANIRNSRTVPVSRTRADLVDNAFLFDMYDILRF